MRHIDDLVRFCANTGDLFEKYDVNVDEDVWQKLDENEVRTLLGELYTLYAELPE